MQTWLQQYCRGTFFHSAYCSLSNPICFWSVWCWRTMVPGEIFTSFAEFQGIVSVHDFWLPIWLPELLQAPLRFLRSFCFARIRLDPLVGQVLHHDCTSMIVSRFTIFTEDLVICCYQVTKIFCTMYDSANASSARGPCNFGPLTDLAISVFGWNEYKHCAYPNPHFSWMWALKIVHEKNWRVSLCVQELYHPPNFLWILAATPGFQNSTVRDLSRQTKGCPVLSCLLFICFWKFLVGLVKWLVIGFTADNGLPRPVINIWTWHTHWRGINFPLILSFSSLTVTWCCCSWWRRRAWGRCRKMPLLSWRCHWSWRMRTGGRRTRWQAWNHDRDEVLLVARYSNAVFHEMWFLTIDPFIRISVFIAKLSERQYCWCVVEDFHSQEYTQFFDIHSCLFMRLHFSIGGYDYRRTTRLRQSVHFSITQVLYADHMHWRSGVHNKFSFLRYKIWCGKAPIFGRWEESCFFLLLQFEHTFGQLPRCFAGT